MSIFQEYLRYHEESQKKYGKQTFVLMQVGSFHESYATNERGPNLQHISEILNIVCTRKDKSILEVSDSNPMMLGFTSVALNKYLKILMANGFTVVVIDQVTPPPKPKRAITRVCSRGTYIEDDTNADSNYIGCIYLEEVDQGNGTFSYGIGLSAIDLTTGQNTVHEVYSKNDDEKLPLDESVRFMNRFSPSEIILIRNYPKKVEYKHKMTKEELLSYLEIENKKLHYHEKYPKEFNKISYQMKFLKKIFPDTGMLNEIEYLGLERMVYALKSYLILLDFAYNHDNNIVQHIFKPEIYDEQKYLVLGNNAIYQLNIVENQQFDFSGRFRSLFDVVNKTSTAMGKRYLKDKLLSPYVSSEKILSCHDQIEKLIEFDQIKKLEEMLNGIIDIERANRRLYVKLLHPQQFSDMISSLEEVTRIIEMFSEYKNMKEFIPEKKVVNSFKSFLKFSYNMVNTTEMKKYNMNDIQNNFFLKGIHPELDKLQDKIVLNTNFMDLVCDELDEYINDTRTIRKKKDDKKITIKCNDRDGYYLYLTKLRAESLMKNLGLKGNKKKIKKIKIDKLEIDPTELKFKVNPAGNSCKIFFDEMNNRSNALTKLREEIMTCVKEMYLEFLGDISDKYGPTIKNICNYISHLDYLKSGAKVAKEYNYCKPTIVYNDDGSKLENGYFNAINLRHPIVERVNEEREYVPHNFSLGKGPDVEDNNDYLDGMLMYGLNACGKSTSMKSIGLSIVLAQAGYYVPADEYKFSPYTSLYARITGNDNIFKGLSSFALEMTELRAILRRTGPKTLVIGDEICRGTEHISGISIVATTINRLAKTKCSFIFATHIHELPEIEEVKTLEHVKPFHLVVKYDKNKDKLIFDRKLKPGTGERIYGITVAKFIIGDNDFIKMTQKIKNNILEKSNKLLNNKTSNYNSNVYINECQVCGKDLRTNELGTGLETHHINFQKNCENGFVNKKNKKHIKKNQASNLAVICEDCHQKTHNGILRIKGYIETSNGIELDYSEEEPVEIKKKEDNKNNNLIIEESDSNNEYEEIKTIVEDKKTKKRTKTNKVIKKKTESKNNKKTPKKTTKKVSRKKQANKDIIEEVNELHKVGFDDKQIYAEIKMSHNITYNRVKKIIQCL